MAPRLVVATGPAGAGKTTLLLRLARAEIARGGAPAFWRLDSDPFDEALFAAEGIGSGREPTLFLGEAAAGRRLASARDAAEARFGAGMDARFVGIADAQGEAAVPAECRGCDALLLNKADTLPEESVERRVAALAAAAGCRVRATVEAGASLAELWEERARDRAGVDGGAPSPSRWWFPLAPGALARPAAELLAADPPPGTLRLKGALELAGEPGLAVIQVTGRSGTLRRLQFAPAPPLGLVAVTRDPAAAALRARLGPGSLGSPLGA